MLKFKEEFDKSVFLTEIGRTDLIGNSVIDFDALDEVETFIKRRRELITKIKDFRKSQGSKAAWRRHRYSMLKGVKKWHKSTDGKKFHRQLGRFLATKVTENYENLSVERYETLKALSSLRTHMYIEGEYFRPSTEDDVDFEDLVEYSMPLLNTLENKLLLYKYEDISYDEVEVALRLVDESQILAALSTIVNIDVQDLTERLNSLTVNEDLTYGITVKYFKLLEKNSQIDYLKMQMEIQDV